MKLKKIICTTDFSALSNHAVYYGIALAKEFKAKLYLCHVIDTSSITMYDGAAFTYESQNGYIRDYANKYIARLIGEHKIDWEPIITVGRAADEIVRIAEEKDVDMAITATRGRSGLKRLILGSVTEHLMRTIPCPLLAVRGPGQDVTDAADQEIRFQRILVGCDFSSDSILAVQYGLSLAQEFQSDLHLVHVMPPIHKVLPKHVIETRERFQQDFRNELNEKLEKLVPKEAFNWCTPEMTLLAGHPYEELVKYAVVQGMDLIVLGVRGHSLVETMFVGSTTDRVVRRSQCPVLSVRPIVQDT
ncbi:MAG: universal stress protein [Deltaproteobacteria bacterium]|nr:universal stress protein [Deltaproteobacteria bacterium]